MTVLVFVGCTGGIGMLRIVVMAKEEGGGSRLLQTYVYQRYFLYRTRMTKNLLTEQISDFI